MIELYCGLMLMNATSATAKYAQVLRMRDVLDHSSHGAAHIGERYIEVVMRLGSAESGLSACPLS